MGLSLSYALSLTGLLSGLVSSFTQTETMLVSVERLEEYSCDLPQEPQGQLPRVGLQSLPWAWALEPWGTLLTVPPPLIPFLLVLTVFLSPSHVTV